MKYEKSILLFNCLQESKFYYKNIHIHHNENVNFFSNIFVYEDCIASALLLDDVGHPFKRQHLVPSCVTYVPSTCSS